MLFYQLTKLSPFLLHRKLRSKPHVCLFANSCLALFGLYVMYIGAVYGQSTSCVVFSALLNYTFLVALVSILAESMHLLVFKLMSSFSTAYFVTAVVASWGQQYCMEESCLSVAFIVVLPYVHTHTHA